MSDYVRCKLINQFYERIPGAYFNCWGRQWIVQPNGDAVGMVHKSSIAAEAAAGRFVILEEEPVKKSVPNPLSDFGMDIGNYFGAGDLDNLQKKLSVLRKNELCDFIQTRFSVNLPPSMSQSDMLAEIMALTEIKETKTEPEKEEEEEEKPVKKRGRPKR